MELLPVLLSGAGVSLLVTLPAAALALPLAIALGLARGAAARPVRLAAFAWIEAMRAVSALILLFLLFYILPLAGVLLPPFATGIAALALNASAYGAEVVRGALLAVPMGQREAAAALGLSRRQALRLVVLPQAVPLMLPGFGNILIEMLKASSLVSLITLTDLTFAGVLLVTSVGRAAEVWLLVLLIYFAMAWPLSLLVARAEARAARFRVA